MGTVNHKGYKKLPPSPLPLNEDEIENFGLEDISEDDPDGVDNNDPILDTAEQDQKDNKENTQAEALKVFLGLKVEDMIKVTAKGKFFNEDGIVRRLKDGQILVKFYTYGTMWEHWMDPSDVRKMSDEEVIKGLTGPSQPITQEDIDGPQPGDRRQNFDNGRPGDRNLVGGLGARNRREDRTASRFSEGQRAGDQADNDKNWNWYKENQREQQGGGYSDGQVEMRGSKDRNSERGAQSDVDAQWGRTSQRQDQRERRNTAESKPAGGANDGGADWSAFVSPVSPVSPQPISKQETDDFFSSLMTDLSQGLDKDSNSRQARKDTGTASANSGSDEDDFFASLMSEISEDEAKGPKQEKPAATRASDEDDFFDSLMSDISADEEVASKKEIPRKKAVVSPSNDDDFFSSLEAELGNTLEAEPAAKAAQSGDEDDFFASLEAELGNTLSESGLEADLGSSSAKASPKGVEVSGDDFLDSLEVDIEAEKKHKKKAASPKQASVSPVPEANSASGNPADLQKRTVPELKEMLRDRGMKVSGKKSELIERLA